MSEQGWEAELGRVSIRASARDVSAGQPRSEHVPTAKLETPARPRVRTPRLQDRDRQIIGFVSRFRQVSVEHVRQAFFASHRSPTRPKDVMKRLVDQGLLRRIERRTVGGANGGSGQFVYYLARAGWDLAGRPTKNPPKYVSVHYDWLAVADVFIDIKRNLNLITYKTEPENHVRINHIMIEPDLHVEIDRGDDIIEAFIEVDMDTETPGQLEEKMARYHHAWLGAPERWEPFPYVVWVVPSDERKKELEALIAKQPKESRPMYRTALFGEVTDVLSQ